jgi:hypothetical protein
LNKKEQKRKKAGRSGPFLNFCDSLYYIKLNLYNVLLTKENNMPKSIKEMVDEALKQAIEDGNLVVKDEDGQEIEDLSIGWAEEPAEDEDED